MFLIRSRERKKVSIANCIRELKASNFSVQLGNMSKKDQSVFESHLPKLTFKLGLTVLLSTFIWPSGRKFF